MSVSRFVMEVVERHRHDQASPMMPNWQLEEKVKESENNLAALQSKYDILNLAFQRREEDARRLAEQLKEASVPKYDAKIVSKVARFIASEAGETVTTFDIMDEMGTDEMTEEEIAKVRGSLTLLNDIGLIASDGMIGWRWKIGGPGRSSSVTKRGR